MAKGVGIVISGAGHEHTDLRCRPEHTDLRGRPRAHRPQRPAPTSTPTSGAGHEHMATGRDPDRQQAARQGGGSHAGGARAQRTGGAVCATAGGRSSCCASHTSTSCADAVVAVPGARSTGRLVRASLWARSDHKRKGYPWGFVERVTP